VKHDLYRYSSRQMNGLASTSLCNVFGFGVIKTPRRLYVFSYNRDIRPLRQQRNKILVNMVAPTNYTSDTPTQKLH
jgi:hypothetical protein